MSTDLTHQLEVLEKPLKFVSKDNFKNLSKVKDLGKVIKDICLKLNSEVKELQLKKEINDIKDSFIDFDSKSKEGKISIVNRILDKLAKLNNKVPPVANFTSEIKEPKNRTQIKLSDPVRYLKGVGPRISDILSKKDIQIVEDLLFYFPRRYEDRRNIKKISSINKLESVVIFGKIIDLHVTRIKSKKIFNVVISDGTGTVTLVWFTGNEKYLNKTYIPGARIVVSGEVSYNAYKKNLQIIHPKPEDVEIYADDEDTEENTHFGRIVPIYPLTEGLTQKRIRTIVKLVVEQFADGLSNIIPDQIIKNYKLAKLSDSIKEVQFPEDTNKIIDLSSASDVFNSVPHKTVSFYEFFLLEVGLILKKKEFTKVKGISFKTGGILVKEFIHKLPFKITEAQHRAVKEIEKDMNGGFPMNRLLQGDVGSGKTIVSIISMLTAVDNGYQAVLMVPTEILCEQHYGTLRNILKECGLNVVLLKSGIKAKEKNKINKLISSGEGPYCCWNACLDSG